MSLDLEKFSPTVAELQKLAEETKAITAVDFRDKAQMKLIKESRIKLRDARTAITKAGKEYREDAVKFSKLVLQKEKELIALVEPEEDRLSALEEKADADKEREDRKELLPRRRERLVAIADGIEVSDDTLLNMDGTAFEGYINERVAAKNEKERIALEEKKKQDEAKAEEERKRIADEQAEKERQFEEKRKADEAKAEEERKRIADEQKKIDEEKLKLQTEKEAREREEKARQEERERIEREEKEKKEKQEREKQEAEERKKADEENRKRDERYKEFLKKNGLGADQSVMLGADFYIHNTPEGKVVLYKKIDELSL